MYNTTIPMSQPTMVNSGVYQQPMAQSAWVSPPSGIIGSPQNLNTSYLGGSHGVINDGVNANLLNQSIVSPVGNLNASNYGPMYGSQMGYDQHLGNSVYKPVYNALGSLIPGHQTGLQPVHNALGQFVGHQQTGVQPIHNALGQLIGHNQTGIQPVHNSLGQLIGHNQTGIQPVYNAIGSLLGHGSGVNHGVQSTMLSNQSPFHGQNSFYNAMYGLTNKNSSILPSGQQVNMHNSSVPYDFNHSKYSPEELNLFEMRRQAVLKKKKKRNNEMCGFLPCVADKTEINVTGPDGKSYTKSERPGCFDCFGGGERRRATEKPDNYYNEKHSIQQKKGCFRNILDTMTCSK